MQVSISQTDEIVDVQGVACRVWSGETVGGPRAGAAVQMFVCAVGVPGELADTLGSELIEIERPQPRTPANLSDPAADRWIGEDHEPLRIVVDRVTLLALRETLRIGMTHPLFPPFVAQHLERLLGKIDELIPLDLLGYRVVRDSIDEN